MFSYFSNSYDLEKFPLQTDGRGGVYPLYKHNTECDFVVSDKNYLIIKSLIDDFRNKVEIPNYLDRVKDIEGHVFYKKKYIKGKIISVIHKDHYLFFKIEIISNPELSREILNICPNNKKIIKKNRAGVYVPEYMYKKPIYNPFKDYKSPIIF